MSVFSTSNKKHSNKSAVEPETDWGGGGKSNVGILFSICPHNTAKGLNFWESFVKNLEEKLEEKINFEPFKTFVEEKEKLNSKIYHLYYAGPLRQMELYQKGYKPVAKFKGQKDVLFIIGKDERVLEKTYIKFATPFTNPPAYGLLDSSFEDVEVVITQDWEEVFKLVKDGEVDVGLMYNETWDQIDDKNDVKIIKSTIFDTYHIFMAHPSVYEKVKPILPSFEFLEEAKDEDVLRSISILKQFELYAKRWEEHDIARSILDIENVGVVIYQDKVVYANKYAVDLLGYSEEEILSKSILDFIYDEDKENIKSVVERRLKRERFKTSHSKVRVVSKTGRILILSVFRSTILYKGKYSGFMLFFDITKEERFERLYHLLREVNQAITLSTVEEELFEKVCKALVEKVGLKFVWIGTKEDNNPFFKIIYKYGEDKGYLDQVEISWREDLPTGRGPTGTTYRSGKITIISNTQTDPRYTPWKEFAKERGFLSAASIPVKVKGEVKYTINLYAPEPEFFDEDTSSVLKELELDLEFALERLEYVRKSIIISTAIEKSFSWVMVIDENFNITYVNDTVCNISGYSREELIGRNPRIFKSGFQPKEFYEVLYKTILSGKPFSGVFINKKKNGEFFHLKTTIYPVEIPPNIKRYIAIGTDITNESRLENEIQKLQNYDITTNLLNRNGFLLFVSERLKQLKSVAILVLIDIKDFSLLNKNFGHEVGNFVLKEIAGRLSLSFPDSEIARTGADEFAIFTELSEKKDIRTYLPEIKEKILKIFSNPIFYTNKAINLSFNAAITVAPDDGSDIETLYKNVTIALVLSKKEGENKIVIFSKEIEKVIEDVSFAKHLIEKAINENLFTLHYQPFFNTKTLRLEGFEALVRIKDKDGTIYYPNKFIEELERSKYLIDFEKWLIYKVKQQSEKWSIPISFNLSANSFENEEYTKYLLSVDIKTPIILEITERVLMKNPTETIRILRNIKESKAIKIAVDDFGIEYSSLKYIKDFPIDEIKIDISFTREIVNEVKTRSLVKAIITLAKELGITTLAEGVETIEQVEILQSLGCDYVQGFLLGKPLPEEEVEKLLNRNLLS